MRAKTEAEVERLSAAIKATTDRYLSGCMSQATWRAHLRGLWDKTRHAGLMRPVLKRVDPLSRRFIDVGGILS